jgi:hypothetical protein
MLVRDAVSTVRSMMTGAMFDEISVLSAAYDPTTDNKVSLRYPKRTIAPGSILSVGLNTFMVMSTESDGAVLEVLPSMDGGPNVPVAANEIVRVRPQFTTWSIVRELQSEIDSMSSADVGLYVPVALETTWVNRVGGTYEVELPVNGGAPNRLVKAEYLVGGSGAWHAFTDAQWQQGALTVRVFVDPPGAVAYKFTLASPFGEIVDLDTNLVTLGIPDYLADIPMYGVAATMALGWEGRRTQPVNQGDSRRPSETPVNSNATLSNRWAARKREAIAAELSRLTREYGYRQPITSGHTVGLGGRNR